MPCSSENARARRARVLAGIDAHRDDRHVVTEIVERDADLLQRQGAGVLARRVEERHDDGLAAHVRDSQWLALLVAHAEVGRRDPGRADRAGEPRRGHRALADREEQDAGDGGEGEQPGHEEGEAQTGMHRRRD